MFGMSKREREAAAAQQAAQKRDWLAHCTRTGFTDQQAEFLYGQLAAIGSRIDSSSQTNSMYAMMAAGMAMSAGGAARAQ